MVYVDLLVLGMVAYAVVFWTEGQTLTPDSDQYFRLGRHLRVLRPFNRRPLWPLLLGDSVRRWKMATIGFLVMTPALFAWYLGSLGLDQTQQILGAVLILSLPGTFRLLVRFPVLVDAQSNFLALLSAGLALRGHFVWAAAVSCLGAASKEHVPVLAACFSGSWIPLLGYIGAASWFLSKPLKKPGSPELYVIDGLLGHRERHSNGLLLDAQWVLLPWGALPFMYAWGAFNAPRWEIFASVTALALCYGFFLVSYDRARIYTVAAPIVIAVALQAGFSPGLTFCLVMLHTLNPWSRQT